MTSVIPYRVEFRIKVEELGRLTQGFGSVVFGFLLLSQLSADRIKRPETDIDQS